MSDKQAVGATVAFLIAFVSILFVLGQTPYEAPPHEANWDAYGGCGTVVDKANGKFLAPYPHAWVQIGLWDYRVYLTTDEYWSIDVPSYHCFDAYYGIGHRAGGDE